jgi:hypothetical protein
MSKSSESHVDCPQSPDKDSLVDSSSRSGLAGARIEAFSPGCGLTKPIAKAAPIDGTGERAIPALELTDTRGGSLIADAALAGIYATSSVGGIDDVLSGLNAASTRALSRLGGAADAALPMLGAAAKEASGPLPPRSLQMIAAKQL